MIQLTGEQQVQAFMIVVMLIIIIRNLMKMPKIPRIIGAVGMVVIVGAFMYINYYHREFYDVLTSF